MANIDITNIKLASLLPNSIKHDLQVKAAAEAIDKQLQEVVGCISENLFLPNLDKLTGSLLDLLAWEYNVDYYDNAASDKIKRNLILKSLDWHRHKGTPYAVLDIVDKAFKGGAVLEWYDYGGLPYHFKVFVDGIKDPSPDMDQVKMAINSVKNVRSWCEGIFSGRILEFKIPIIFSRGVQITRTIDWSFWVHGRDIMHWNGLCISDGIGDWNGELRNQQEHILTVKINRIVKACWDGNYLEDNSIDWSYDGKKFNEEYEDMPDYELSGADKTTITSLNTRRNFAAMHAGKINKYIKIEKAAFGRGGCDPQNKPMPPDPGADPLNLFDKIGDVAISSVDIDAHGTNVTYTIVIDNKTFNGETINECALLDDAGNVVAMGTFEGIIKSDKIETVFKWTEKF